MSVPDNQSAPKRVQRKRTKGWRMPEGAVAVSRPSRWGNPFVVRRVDCEMSGMCWSVKGYGRDHKRHIDHESEARQLAVDAYRAWLLDGEHLTPEQMTDMARKELAGRDLACWCPLDQPCHADVLLEVANA